MYIDNPNSHYAVAPKPYILMIAHSAYTIAGVVHVATSMRYILSAKTMSSGLVIFISIACLINTVSVGVLSQ